MLEIIGKVVSVAAGYIGGDKGRKIKEAIDTLKNEAAVNPEIQKLMIESDLEMRRLALADADGIRKLLMIEVQSEDKFVRRVRPAVGWLVIFILTTYFVIIPLVTLLCHLFGYAMPPIPIPDMPASVTSLIVSLIGFYMGARSWDKRNKMKFTNMKES